jgi:hypothetical protein
METPSSSPTPSLTPPFGFPDDYERESDTNLRIYGPPQSTKDKIYSWDFVVVDSVEHSDSPDEDACVDDKKDVVNVYSSCKKEETRKNIRPDSQEIQQFGSGHKNEALLLTEKFLSGSYRKMAFPSSSMDILPIGNLNNNRDCVLTPSLSSEGEVNKQELIASDVNSTRQFQVPDIIEEKCESCSSLNKFSVSYSKSVKEVESEKVPVSKGVCFCDNDVHNNNNNNINNNKLVTHNANAECRDRDQFIALSCGAGTVQNNSQVKGNNKSIQMITDFSSESQNMLPLCQDYHDDDIDAQVLSQNTSFLLLETEILVEMAQNFASLSSGSSVILNPGMMHVQSALDIERRTDGKQPHSCQEVQSCSTECNKLAASGHSLSHETSSPGSSDPIMTTHMHTTNESPFAISYSSDKIRYFLAIKNSLLSSESANSVESHKLKSFNNCKEQPQNQTSKRRMLPCNKVFELSRLLPLDNMISKFKNEPVTVCDCSVKNLFRSASVPVDICSTRILEKQIPYLFVMSRTLSCGNITTSCSIQDLRVCPDAPFENCGEESVLKQEPRTEQNNSISSAHSSVIEAPAEHKQEKKHDQKSSSDGKCFGCCILL